MAVSLSPRNAARAGADVAPDSTDGIFGGRPVIVVRADVASKARTVARRRVRRVERREFREALRRGEMD